MFIMDMFEGIMPYTHGGGQGSKFAVRLDREDAALERTVAGALDRQGYRHHLADALCDFMRDAAQELFTYGRAAYEIVCVPDAAGARDGFEFASIHPLSLKRFLGRYYQVIPWWVARGSHCKAGITKLPTGRIICIDFPKELGGRKQIRRILSRLTALGRILIPHFHVEAIRNNENLGFDLDEYQRAKYLEKARLTKDLGWHQRQYLDNRILEYYSVHRYLRDALSKAIIREHVLDAVNATLSDPMFNLNARIVMSGLPTADQIRSEFKRLESGNLSFKELNKRISVL